MGNKKYNKTVPTIRILAAMYLLWTSYGIAKGLIAGDSEVSPFMVVMAVLFAVCAVFFIVTATKDLKQIEKAKKEDAEREALENLQEEEPEPETQPRKMSIRERARLTENLQVPDGVVDEIEDDGELEAVDEEEEK